MLKNEKYSITCRTLPLKHSMYAYRYSPYLHKVPISGSLATSKFKSQLQNFFQARDRAKNPAIRCCPQCSKLKSCDQKLFSCANIQFQHQFDGAG